MICSSRHSRSIARITTPTKGDTTSQYFRNASRVSGSVVRVRASYSTNHDKLTVGAYVNNVADKRYKNQAMLYQGAVAGAGGHYPTGYGDPRLFGLTLTLKY